MDVHFPHVPDPPSPHQEQQVPGPYSHSASPSQHGLSEDRQSYETDQDHDLHTSRFAMIEFVDTLATSYKLSPQYHRELLLFSQMHDGVPMPSLRLAVHQQATAYQTQEMVLQTQSNYHEAFQVMQEVKEQLRQTAPLTTAQKEEIVNTCKKLVFQAGRTAFNISEEVMVELAKAKQTNGFAVIFDSPVRLKDLRTTVGRQASAAKDSLRTMLRDSLYSKRVTLSALATKAAKLFLGSTVAVQPSHIMQLAIYREFARHNKDILNIASELNEDSLGNEDDGARPVKRRRGRVPEGEDFWSRMEGFFKEKADLWGLQVLTSPEWKSYIEKCLEQERHDHPNDRFPLLPTSLTSSLVPRASASNTSAANLTSAGHSGNDIVASGRLSANSVIASSTSGRLMAPTHTLGNDSSPLNGGASGQVSLPHTLAPRDFADYRTMTPVASGSRLQTPAPHRGHSFNAQPSFPPLMMDANSSAGIDHETHGRRTILNPHMPPRHY